MILSIIEKVDVRPVLQCVTSNVISIRGSYQHFPAHRFPGKRNISLVEIKEHSLAWPTKTVY